MLLSCVCVYVCMCTLGSRTEGAKGSDGDKAIYSIQKSIKYGLHGISMNADLGEVGMTARAGGAVIVATAHTHRVRLRFMN